MPRDGTFGEPDSGFVACDAFGVDGAGLLADPAACPGFTGVCPGFLVILVGVLGVPVCFPAAGEGAMFAVFLVFVTGVLLREPCRREEEEDGDDLVGVGGKE